MLHKKLLFMLAAILIGTGCYSAPETVEFDRFRNFPAEINAGDIVHVATGEKISFSQLTDSLDGAEIVYVGEIHDNREAHDLQVAILKEFYNRYGNNIAIGMEMFKRPYQETLDRWIEGKISEEELLNSTDWWHEWGYNYSYYKDILDFSYDKTIPVIALNITEKFRKKISETGIEGLSSEERKSLPPIDMEDFYHRKYLEWIFKSHGDVSADFERFYEVQCVWEDIMADSIARYLSSPQGKDRKLLVFIGGGHIIYHFGVPKRVFRRNHLPYRTIETYELKDLKPEDEHPLFARDIPLQPADYIKAIQPSTQERKVALGVMIRNLQDTEPDEMLQEQELGVIIESVLQESPAGVAGLQAGDIIMSMDGESIEKVYQVIHHVGKKKEGDTCLIEISREGKTVPVDVTFFELKEHGKK